MANEESPLLSLELIPKTVFGENLRNRLTATQWDKCKKFAKDQSNGVCALCGNVGAKGRVECHELWEWTETKDVHIQRLVGLIALCPRCHSAKHYGRAQLMGFADDANEQLLDVNGWTRAELKSHILTATAEWIERSRHEWQLDLDWLPQNLGITAGPPRESQYSQNVRREELARKPAKG